MTNGEIIFQEAVTCKLPLRGPSRCFIGSQSAHYRKSSRGGGATMWCFVPLATHSHIHTHIYTCNVMQSHIPHVPRHTLFTGDRAWCRETFQVHWLWTNNIRSQKSSREQRRLQKSGNNTSCRITSQHRVRLEPIKVCGHHLPSPGWILAQCLWGLEVFVIECVQLLFRYTQPQGVKWWGWAPCVALTGQTRWSGDRSRRTKRHLIRLSSYNTTASTSTTITTTTTNNDNNSLKWHMQQSHMNSSSSFIIIIIISSSSCHSGNHNGS